MSKQRSPESLFQWGWILYPILIVYGLVTLLPFLWALSASLKPLADIVRGGANLMPSQPTLENYRQIFIQEPLFGRWFANSLLVAGVVTATNLIFNSMAGYALARIRFPGRQFYFFLVLAVLVVPGQVTLIPSYLILNFLGWLNSYQGLIVPAMVNATFIFMMRQFFITFPKELEEAAAIDGLGRLETFWLIVLPLAKPALAAQGIFIFMGTWNDFLKPLVILSDPNLFTLPLGLNAFKGAYITYWNYLMAASVMVTLPVLLIYVFCSGYFIQGIRFTGSKG